MSLVVKKQENITVVELQRKRIDASYAINLREDVVALVEQGSKKIVLNLGNVEFIDSSGLGALVSIMKAVGGNQNMALCQVKDAVMTVLKLTRMDKIFVVLPGEAEAIARLG